MQNYLNFEKENAMRSDKNLETNMIDSLNQGLASRVSLKKLT